MKEPPAPRHQQFPFSAWRGHPRVMPGAHVHTDIELNLFLAGAATYFLAGRFYEVPPQRLAVFWAGMPHRLVAVERGSEYLCMTLPLAWFLGWGLDSRLSQRLLAGELLLESDPENGTLDGAQFARWVGDLRHGGAGGAQIAMLEVEARLRRLAASLAPVCSPSSTSPTEGVPERSRQTGETYPDAARGRQMERMAEYVGRRFREPLSVAEVAEAVGLNPNYAMTVFKAGCGLSLYEYVTRLRVSHAQRLLLTTDWTVERVALDCGFGSAARFFATFKRLCGATPRAYRRQHVS